MLDNHDNSPETCLIRPSRRPQPDITASLIIKDESGKSHWQPYFSVFDDGEGFFKGKDIDGNTILVLNREAKDAITGTPPNPSKKRPDLFIFIEAEDENGEPIWDEILVSWKGRKDGTFKTQNAEGHDIILQTREAKEAALAKTSTKRIAASALANIGKQHAEDSPKEESNLAEDEAALAATD